MKTDLADDKNVNGANAAKGLPRGENCAGCRRELPVRAKRPDEVTAHWECTSCHTPLTGMLLKDSMPLQAAHIHLGHKHFDASQLPPIPPELRQLLREFCVRRQQADKSPAEDRRQSERVPQQLDVIVVPVSEDWAPQGKPILGIVMDLASHGLGMITTGPVSTPYVVAQLKHGNSFVQLLGKIAWTKEFVQGFHNAGVQFVLRFGRGAADWNARQK